MRADIIIDIETAVHPVTTRDIERRMTEYEPPTNWKDPVKILRHREGKEASALQDIIKERTFSLGGKRMISCALGVAVPEERTVDYVQSFAGENLGIICEGIRQYLSEFSEYRLIGWNHKKFDLPEIVKSFELTKTPLPRCRPGKYVVDLCDQAPFRGLALKEVAEACGLTTLGITGADIARLHADGDWDEIQRYNEHDVSITGQIFNIATGWFTF